MWTKLNCIAESSRSALTQSACQGHPVQSLIEGEFPQWSMLPQVGFFQSIALLLKFYFLIHYRGDAHFLSSFVLLFGVFCLFTAVCLYLLLKTAGHSNIPSVCEWGLEGGTGPWLNVMNIVLKAMGLMTVCLWSLGMPSSNLDRARKYNVWIQLTQPVEYQHAWCVAAETVQMLS